MNYRNKVADIKACRLLVLILGSITRIIRILLNIDKTFKIFKN